MFLFFDKYTNLKPSCGEFHHRGSRIWLQDARAGYMTLNEVGNRGCLPPEMGGVCSLSVKCVFDTTNLNCGGPLPKSLPKSFQHVRHDNLK